MRAKGWVPALVVGVGLLLVGLPAAAQTIYPMYFPVIGETRFTDTYGAPRGGGRTHAGIDLMAPKMTPVVAVSDATVGWMHDDRGGNCCALALLHDDGWQSWYIHLNNDTPGTDDGQGWGFADGIAEGVRVRAGQLIGWVGDSGNAEWTSPHLHFELHPPGGGTMNPYDSLLAAERLPAPIPAGFTPPFWDDDGSVHEADIIAISEAGITAGCAPEQYCPAQSVNRAAMATFLLRATGLADVLPDYQGYFTDVEEGLWYTGFVEGLYEQELTAGCNEALYCPERSVTRAEMAAFLLKGMGHADHLPAYQSYFTDVPEQEWYSGAVEHLYEHGVTAGLSEGIYGPEQAVTRAQMATFLNRAFLEAPTGS